MLFRSDRLDHDGFDSDLLTGAIEDALACGEAVTGLRTLARHWRDASRADSNRVHELAARLVAGTGAPLAVRIALSEDCPTLAEWVSTDVARVRDVAAVMRLDSLRRSLDEPVPGSPSSGDEVATPGR